MKAWILKIVHNDSNATETYHIFKTRDDAYKFMIDEYFDGDDYGMDEFLVEDMTDCWNNDGWIFEITDAQRHF